MTKLHYVADKYLNRHKIPVKQVQLSLPLTNAMLRLALDFYNYMTK